MRSKRVTDLSAAAFFTWHMSAGTNAQILHGLASHRRYRGLSDGLKGRPPAQVFFCIDEREESMRRALEEARPGRSRLSAPAGYFGVAVDYQGN